MMKMLLTLTIILYGNHYGCWKWELAVETGHGLVLVLEHVEMMQAGIDVDHYGCVLG